MSTEVQTTAATETDSGTADAGALGLLGKLAEAAASMRASTEEVPAADAPATETTQEAAPAAEKPAEETPQVQEEKAEETDPRFAALAKRERDLQTRHKEIKDAHSQLEEARRAVDVYEQARKNAEVDPVAFIKSLKLNTPLDAMAKALWYEVLGEEAPAEAKQDRRFTQMEAKLRQQQSELENLRREREEMAREQEIKSRVANIQSEFKSFVESNEVPEIKLRYSKQADVVLDDLLNVAAELGDAGDEEWMNPEKVAAALEQRYREERARYESLYGPFGATPKTEPVPGASKNEAAPRTLSNRIANQTAPASEPSEEERFKMAEQRMLAMLNQARQ